MAITPSNYTYRQLITGASPSATNSGQVLLIDENSVDSTFFSNAQNGGGDIRVCENSDGTSQLPIEVLECDNVGNTLKVWTRKPTYSSASRDIYIFCGTATTDSQPAVTDTYGRNNVWQDYAASFHLNDHASVVDSSGNITSGITIAGSPTGTRQVFGQDVIDFDGVNDAIGLGVNVIPAGATNATIQAIIRADAAATNNTAIFSNDATRGYAFWFDNSGFNSGNAQIISAGCDLTDTLPNRIETATNSILPNTDYHVVFREDGGGGGTLRNVFINDSTAGASVQTGATGFDSVSPARTDAIGGNTGANGWTALNFFNGGIGEFRARLDTLSDSFIETEYANISNRATFWTQSTPDNPSGGGGAISVTGATPSYSYSAISGTVDLTGEITVTGATPSYSYAAVNGVVDLTPEITITGQTPSYSYGAVNGVVTLTPTGQINVTGQTPSYSYSAIGATVLLQGIITVTGATPTYAYTAISATVQLGELDIVTNFSGTVKQSEFSGSIKTAQFLGAIKEASFSGNIKQSNFIGVRR